MEFLIVGFITSLIGGFPYCDVGIRDIHDWGKKWLWFLVGGTLVWSATSYVAMPVLIGPFWGIALTMMILTTLAINVFSSVLLAENTGYKNQSKVVTRAIWIGAFALVLPAVRGLGGWSAFNADSYRAFAGNKLTKRDWQEDISPTDTAHIRMVSRQQAEWMGNKALGQAEGSLGSRYKVGKYNIQKVRGKLVWVAPLEFTGFRSWNRFGHVPGYVMVSAENPSESPELVIDHKLIYMPSAFFSSNLERYIYTHGYQSTGTVDYTFEIDEEGKPFWVITLYDLDIQYWGEKITGTLILDPATGKMQKYSVADTPDWVDRIIPEHIAFQRLTWYGQYIHGWFNSWWGEEDVNIPTNSHRLGEMWLVWGEDGQAYWFTGFTSSQSSDSALVGFAMMDSRTGRSRYYRLSGADETAVLEVANSAVSNYSGYHGTQPILYNIYGELTWVVPIISQENIFQKLCLVRASTSESVLGETKREALVAYRRLLQSTSNQDSPSAQSQIQTLTGTIKRFAADTNNGNTTYYICIDGDKTSRIYSGSSSINYEIVLSKVGDRVQVQYFDTRETVVPLSSFDLLDLTPRVPAEDD